jgi:hypothetical protein
MPLDGRTCEEPAVRRRLTGVEGGFPVPGSVARLEEQPVGGG